MPDPDFPVRTWLPWPPGNLPRGSFAPRRVLITGGTSSDVTPTPLRTAEIFDPATNGFTLVKGGMTASRLAHASTTIDHDVVLVTGGLSQVGNIEDYAATAEVFSGGRFHAVKSMHATRAGHTSAVIYSGRTLIVGGVGTDWEHQTPHGRELAAAEYMPEGAAATQQFAFTRTTVGMSQPRLGHSATPMKNRSEMVIIGGWAGGSSDAALTSAEVYGQNPVDTFTPTIPMQHGRMDHTATRLNDHFGTVLVCGGHGSRVGTGVLQSAELFDPLG